MTKSTDTKKPLAMDGFKKKTFIVNETFSDKLDAISYWDRQSLKDITYEMQEKFINAWEKKNGPVKPIPNKK